MKRLGLTFIPLFLFLVFAASAQESTRSKFAYAGFSGGMMIHTGYLYGGSISPATDAGCNCLYDRKIAGAPFGIGGAARVHFGEHLRIGTEGYVSTLNYGGKGNDSFARLGWGGVLADCISSRKGEDKEYATRRMSEAGAFITTYESALFEMLVDAKAPEFKAISAIVR